MSAEEAIRRIVRSEVQAAQQEDRQYLARLARATGTLAVASFVLLLGAGFVALMVVYILGELTEPWVGAAIVGGAIVLAAGLFARTSLRRSREILEGSGRRE